MNATQRSTAPKGNVVVTTSCAIGDLTAAIPALRLIREAIPDGRICLVPCTHREYLDPEAFFAGTGLVDDVMHPLRSANGTWRSLYPVQLRIFRRRLRIGAYRTALVLETGNRVGAEDRLAFKIDFLRSLGIEDIYWKHPLSAELAMFQRGEIDLLPNQVSETHRLAAKFCGVAAHEARYHFPLGRAHEADLDRWIPRVLEGMANRPLVAVGIGGSVQRNHWPLDRFVDVLSHLARSHGILPLLFGGVDDRADATRVIAAVGVGRAVLGESPHRVVGLMRKCRFYVGNNTGSLHLAAASGLECIGLFSDNDLPGQWYPPGERHTILQSRERIEEIQADVVIVACERRLRMPFERPVRL